MGYEIKLESAKFKKVNSITISSKANMLILILKSLRITVLTDVKDSKIEVRSSKNLNRLDEVEQ